LAGSNRRYIEEVIPHIGSLLMADLKDVVHDADVVVVETKSVQGERLSALLLNSQLVIDLFNFEPSQRTRGTAPYEGICW